MTELTQATKAYYSTVEGFVTGDPLLLNLRRVAGHIKRERDMYVFGGGGVLDWKNGEACGDTLMNGHWEELFGKVEELLHATDHPHNYPMHIRHIIQFSSDGLQRLKSFLRLHMRKCVQGVTDCVWLCIGPLHQQLVKRVKWIHDWMGRPIVNEAFDQVLRDHPDLHDAVKAQVSVLCRLFK